MITTLTSTVIGLWLVGVYSYRYMRLVIRAVVVWNCRGDTPEEIEEQIMCTPLAVELQAVNDIRRRALALCI